MNQGFFLSCFLAVVLFFCLFEYGFKTDFAVKIIAYPIIKSEKGWRALKQEKYLVLIKANKIFLINYQDQFYPGILFENCEINDKNNWQCFKSETKDLKIQMVDGKLYNYNGFALKHAMHYVSWWEWWYYKFTNFTKQLSEE